MTTTRTAKPARSTQEAETYYVFLMTEAHRSSTLAGTVALEGAARRVAADYGLDEMALEGRVLDAVFALMTDDDLAKAVIDPSKRTRARAEQRRRAA